MKSNPLIKSVMTPFPHSIDINASIIEARRFMMTHHIRHLPVTQDAELIGVLTDRDIKLILGPDFNYPSQQELSVRDVYIDEPYIVSLDEPLTNVLAVMAEKHVGSVLVTRKGKLAGVFTSTDVCRSFHRFITEKLPPSDDGDDAA